MVFYNSLVQHVEPLSHTVGPACCTLSLVAWSRLSLSAVQVAWKWMIPDWQCLRHDLKKKNRPNKSQEKRARFGQLSNHGSVPQRTRECLTLQIPICIHGKIPLLHLAVKSEK